MFSKIILMPRDIKILTYLFENRGATLNELRNTFFDGKSKKTVYRRLVKLRTNGLLATGVSGHLKELYYYYITSKGFKKCYQSKDNFDGIRHKSPNFAHDNAMTKVRYIMERSRIIHNYYTENMMSLNLYQWQLGDIFMNNMSFRPDALFVTKTEKEIFFNAIELELNQKGSKEYSKKIINYYLNRNIAFVIVITSSKTIKNMIAAEEKRLYPDGVKKIYYGNFKDLVDKKLPFVFKNSGGFEYEL